MPSKLLHRGIIPAHLDRVRFQVASNRLPAFPIVVRIGLEALLAQHEEETALSRRLDNSASLLPLDD